MQGAECFEDAFPMTAPSVRRWETCVKLTFNIIIDPSGLKMKYHGITHGAWIIATGDFWHEGHKVPNYRYLIPILNTDTVKYLSKVIHANGR